MIQKHRFLEIGKKRSHPRAAEEHFFSAKCVAKQALRGFQSQSFSIGNLMKVLYGYRVSPKQVEKLNSCEMNE